MFPYSDYKKPRAMIEVFRLIKNKHVNTTDELATMFAVSKDTIQNYIKDLNNYFETDIVYDHSLKSYKINDEEGSNAEGILESLKYTQPITADDVFLILASLMKSETFMETKMAIIKNSLLSLLPKNEANKLKDMLHFEKENTKDHQYIEFNTKNLRKAISDEKKVSFSYKSAVGNLKTHIIIPYSFAADQGKFYIIGFKESKNSLTPYRLDRMSNIKILDEIGKRDEKFNVYDYLKKTWNMFGGKEITVRVKFKPHCYKVVTEKSLVEGNLVEKTDDYFIYDFICNGFFGIKLWLLGFGGNAEVLEPSECREEMIIEAQNMINTYSTN